MFGRIDPFLKVNLLRQKFAYDVQVVEAQNHCLKQALSVKMMSPWSKHWTIDSWTGPMLSA
jgi:hypothetical protein